jgi:thioesterase domain-containing protein
LFQAPTIEQLANLLNKQVQLAPWSSLIPIQPNGAKPPFFCVHGGISDRHLSRYLGPDQPLYGLAYSDGSGQPVRYKSVEDIAAHYLSEICTVQPSGPYFLGGYSFGGIVAFEMAQQLKDQGQKVALLCLLAPSAPCDDQLSSGLPRNTTAFSTKRRSFRDGFSRHLQKLKLYGLKERLTRVRQLGCRIAQQTACKIYCGLGYSLPSSVQGTYILGVFRKAIRDYIPKIYPGRLVIYKDEGSSDPRVWKILAAGELEIHEVPGDHGSILAERNVEIWGKQLSADLHQTQSELIRFKGRDQWSAISGQRIADGEAASRKRQEQEINPGLEMSNEQRANA